MQIGGQNVIIDPNFARWLFVLKRLRQPGVRVRDLAADRLWCWSHTRISITCTVPRCGLLCSETRRRRAKRPTIVVPHHVFDLVSDLGFEDMVELDWWSITVIGDSR